MGNEIKGGGLKGVPIQNQFEEVPEPTPLGLGHCESSLLLSSVPNSLAVLSGS